MEENNIVSEVTFGETAGGAAVLQGQFVSSDKGKAAAPTFGFGRRYAKTESREITIANARKRIQNVALAVRLNDHHVEMAHRWFILAIQHNFTKGRRGQNVVAACLYIVCRQEKTPHMLLDFSEVLHSNVYSLGNTFLRLVRLLNLEIPLIDPSLYIGRFVARLGFGDRTQVVANTALRLVARMKRDWIQTGRRPAGICGACILISAKMHNFERSIKQIIYVVRVCEATIKRRLAEFSETPSSKLTVQQFHEVWLEQEADPPSFTLGKKKEAEAKIELKESEMIPVKELESEMKENLAYIKDHNLETILTPDSESLSDVESDEEMLSILLEDDEIVVKTMFWNEDNEEYIKQQEAKQLAVDEENKEKEKKPAKKRKPREPGTKPPVAETAVEATKQILTAKKFSKKINYQALEDLFDNSSLPVQ